MTAMRRTNGRDGVPSACARGGVARGIAPHQPVGHELDQSAQEEEREERPRRGAEPRDGGGAQSRRGVPGQVVPAEGGGQPLARRVTRDDDLLEREEGARLAGADGQVSGHGRGHDHPRLAGQQEDQRPRRR